MCVFYAPGRSEVTYPVCFIVCGTLSLSLFAFLVVVLIPAPGRSRFSAQLIPTRAFCRRGGSGFNLWYTRPLVSGGAITDMILSSVMGCLHDTYDMKVCVVLRYGYLAHMYFGMRIKVVLSAVGYLMLV